MAKTSTLWSKGRLIFDAFLFLVALVFFIYSFELNFRSWVFPGAFSLALLIMAGVQTGMDVCRGRKTLKAEEVPSDGDGEGSLSRSRYARLGVVVFSIIVFFLLFRFFTIYVAIPVLCASTLKYLGKKSWPAVGLVSVSIDLFVYLFFQLVLNTAL